MPRVDYEKLTDDRTGEPSAMIRERVEAARERQQERFTGSERLVSNGDMGPAEKASPMAEPSVRICTPTERRCARKPSQAGTPKRFW